MKILCWNCQGLGNPLTVQALRAYVAQERPHLVILMETKNKEEFCRRIARRLKFTQVFILDPRGLAGGWAILWGPEVTLSIGDYSQHFIDISVTDEETTQRMKVTAVHAPNNFAERLKLWEELSRIGALARDPWICLGDFNEVLYVWEKVGGRPPENYRMRAFQDFLDSCLLMDLESKGCAFTWANNRQGTEFIKERLDRAVSTLEWRVSFPNAEIYTLPALGSDHSPFLVVTNPVHQKRKHEFKFESYWLEDAEYDQTFKETWHRSDQEQEVLTTRLERMTSTLHSWSKRRFTNARQQIQTLQDELKLHTNRISPNHNAPRVQWLKGEIEKTWRREEQYWGMRSRIKWLSWGDKNTRFFHATTVQRRHRNKMKMLKTESGEWTRDPGLINRLTMQYFRDLYTSGGQRAFTPVIDQIPQIVGAEINGILTGEATNEEITRAVFQLGATKAPGPDGLNGKFFQHHWATVKGEVFKEIRNFMSTGQLNPKLNHTHIILIPKTQHPESLEQYRPISLCNFLYKIISKVLANRLKPFMHGIIVEEQSAFVGGRQIQDNILIAQEVLHQMRIKKRKRRFQAVVKMDMSKAYDRIEWDFLEACMRKMGFNEVWVRWIVQCVTTVSFSVKVNGEPLPAFQPTRGLHQGDPLSPYLFISVADVLSKLLKKNIEDGSLQGIKLNRHCPTLSHLLFADDLIVFVEGKVLE